MIDSKLATHVDMLVVGAGQAGLARRAGHPTFRAELHDRRRGE
jgi:hypothetical protein